MNELQRILLGKIGRTSVNLARKDQVNGVSMSRHLLVWVEVHYESTMALLDSGAIPNIISHKMVKKLHFRMRLTNRSIKVANYASEKYVGLLNDVPRI